jgi:hypothetical protein
MSAKQQSSKKAQDPTVVDEKGYATQDQLCHYSSHFFLPWKATFY